MKNAVLRQATDEDYERVITRLDAWWGGRDMAAMLPRLFFSHFRPWTFVAEENDELLGFLAGFRSQSDASRIYCHFIGVNPDARGRGIGEALYQRLLADAALAGCTEALAVTSPVNKGSVAFHLRLGFEMIPGSNSSDGVPYTPDYDGPGEDRVRFRRAITAPRQLPMTDRD